MLRNIENAVKISPSNCLTSLIIIHLLWKTHSNISLHFTYLLHGYDKYLYIPLTFISFKIIFFYLKYFLLLSLPVRIYLYIVIVSYITINYILQRIINIGWIQFKTYPLSTNKNYKIVRIPVSFYWNWQYKD